MRLQGQAGRCGIHRHAGTRPHGHGGRSVHLRPRVRGPCRRRTHHPRTRPRGRHERRRQDPPAYARHRHRVPGRRLHEALPGPRPDRARHRRHARAPRGHRVRGGRSPVGRGSTHAQRRPGSHRGDSRVSRLSAHRPSRGRPRAHAQLGGLMTGLMSLWLPILLSAAIVFVISSAIHMLLPWHRSDYPKMPNEDRVRDALRPLAIPPGDYMVPRPSSREELASPAFLEKMKQGPNFIMTMLPSGPWSMARNLSMWFAYALVVGLFSAYITGRALPPGAQYLQVFRFAGATAFIGYSAALWQMSIWYRRAWLTTIKSTVDGL